MDVQYIFEQHWVCAATKADSTKFQRHHARLEIRVRSKSTGRSVRVMPGTEPADHPSVNSLLVCYSIPSLCSLMNHTQIDLKLCSIQDSIPNKDWSSHLDYCPTQASLDYSDSLELCIAAVKLSPRCDWVLRLQLRRRKIKDVEHLLGQLTVPILTKLLERPWIVRRKRRMIVYLDLNQQSESHQGPGSCGKIITYQNASLPRNLITRFMFMSNRERVPHCKW